jgi:hypothetical protein
MQRAGRDRPADAQRPKPILQLTGRLPSERDGKHVARVEPPGQRPIRDPPSEHPSLPSPSPSKDGQRRGITSDRLALPLIKVGEKILAPAQEIGHEGDRKTRV